MALVTRCLEHLGTQTLFSKIHAWVGGLHLFLNLTQFLSPTSCPSHCCEIMPFPCPLFA